ncbi:transposase [Roseicella sp. DB1501]|nr:transposase [Roseicella sp. DB1501]
MSLAPKKKFLHPPRPRPPPEAPHAPPAPSHRHYTPRRPWAPLTDAAWAAIEPHLRAVTPHQGRPLADARGRIDAMFLIAASGQPWRSLPEAYGRPDTVSRHFRRLAQAVDAPARRLRRAGGAARAAADRILPGPRRPPRHAGARPAGGRGGGTARPAQRHAGAADVSLPPRPVPLGRGLAARPAPPSPRGPLRPAAPARPALAQGDALLCRQALAPPLGRAMSRGPCGGFVRIRRKGTALPQNRAPEAALLAFPPRADLL